MTIQQALQQAKQQLTDASPSATLDAQVLLCHVLQCNSAHLLTWPDKVLEQQQITSFQNYISQRKTGLPVAHITGEREFWSLTFQTDNSTLIPRPETETLVEFILQKFTDIEPLKLLDLGTGSGAIAIAIAHEKPSWQIFASELSEDALALAKTNSKKNNTSNIHFINSDWFTDINETSFDIIVSNPPYIADDDEHLQHGDVRFEPLTALTAGATGMDDIEKICAQAKTFLNRNGWLIVEHGYHQQQTVKACFVKNGFKQIIQKNDLSGIPRLTAACASDSV